MQEVGRNTRKQKMLDIKSVYMPDKVIKEFNSMLMLNDMNNLIRGFCVLTSFFYDIARTVFHIKLSPYSI